MLYQLNKRVSESPPVPIATQWTTPKIIRTALLFAIPLVIFVVVAIGALGNKPLPGDLAILNTIQEFSFPQLDKPMITITAFGNASILVPLAVLAAGGLFFLKKRYQALFLLFCAGGTSVLTLVFKQLFRRDRPQLWKHLVTETDYSFPSGHAMITSTLAICIIVLCWHTKFRMPAIIIGTVYCVTVALSRLYVGVHYPSDILGGWGASVLVVATLYYGLRYVRGRFKKS